MSTEEGTIENTFVQLKTAPTGGDGTVKFHAQMTDASGGDFEEWGFFYKESETDTAPSSTNKDDTVIANDPGTAPGSGEPVSFTHTSDKSLTRAKKNYFNAYLYDDDNSKYVYQNPTAEGTAPTGISFTIPNVDHKDIVGGLDPAVPGTFSVTLTGALEGDHETIAWDDTAFPRVQAGFKYRPVGGGPWISINKDGGWNEGPPLNWSATILDLSNNQQNYESSAWMEVKPYNSIGETELGTGLNIVIESATMRGSIDR